ncbi:D-alanyl-D-alanine carboxypeptidase family protein [Neobacillus sp. BF23-41]|uniref:M15 family metallopeptidase n=1 Tax=Neobacillus sp. BF23-41 TaxID=3240280 RepID=UPI0034E600FA
MFKLISTGFCCIVVTISLAGCSLSIYNTAQQNSLVEKQHKGKQVNEQKQAHYNFQNNRTVVVSNPESIPVLVDKQNKLPAGYVPKDLVFTQIPFVPSPANSEKHEMRNEAAAAIKKLFDAAKAQGVNFLGVSAYRSEKTQISLFNTYVNRDGYLKARTYSALPGTSEHETGLAIDVTEGDGKCAAADCFSDSTEAKWLQEHAADYGFIIRYPKGKEAITGYQYESWHLRYVGKKLAKEITSQGITLEEYYNAAKVNN